MLPNGDIARLMVAAVATAAIEHPAGGPVAGDEPLPHRLLFGSDARIARVGEDEEIECPALRLPRQRTPDRLEVRRHAPRILVVHRHRDGGACAQRPSGHFADLNGRRIAPDQRNRKTRDCGPEGAGNPGKQGEKEQQAHQLDPAQTVGLQNVQQQCARTASREKGQTEKQRAPQAHMRAHPRTRPPQGVH